jgi:hypothetical protein
MASGLAVAGLLDCQLLERIYHHKLVEYMNRWQRTTAIVTPASVRFIHSRCHVNEWVAHEDSLRQSGVYPSTHETGYEEIEPMEPIGVRSLQLGVDLTINCVFPVDEMDTGAFPREGKPPHVYKGGAKKAEVGSYGRY